MAKSAIKFQDSISAFEHLKKQIAAREYSPIYLLMGEESYFIDALCSQLAESILPEEQRAFGQVVLYGKDSDAGQVATLARQMPMMGGYQVVILRQAQQLPSLEKLSLYTKTPSPSTILIICHNEKSVDKRSQLYKSIMAKGIVFESVRPRDYEIGPWLSGFIKQRGLSIDAKALAMLTDHLGTDIKKISGEIDKLLVSLPQGVKKISDTEIEQNIGISKEYNNFELCRAVVTRDIPQAMRIADHFAQNPKEYPLLVTIMALFGQFKQIFMINYLRWQNRHRGVSFPSDIELMKLLKLNNSFIVGQIKQQSTLWDNRKVFAILGLMREYDAKSKGINSGGVSNGELLRELLLKIFRL